METGPREVVPILGTVTPGAERLCPVLERQLDAMWPEHGPLYYALPAGRTAPYLRVLPTGAVSWTRVLHEGLVQLRDRLGCSHVLVLLEDHVPLWPCDGALIAELCGVARGADLRCLYFCMHDWPWESTAHTVDSDGRIRGWQAIDMVTIGGHRLARMPRNDLFYNRCQPALWSIDDYIELTGAAAGAGIDDPWRFETFLLPDQPDHFVSGYRWPSRKQGYRRHGKVYLRAIYRMAMPASRELRDDLLRERFPRLAPSLRGAFGDLLGLWGRLRGVPHRVEQPGRASRLTSWRDSRREIL